ncbi:hypothetical protein PINS_up012897 [Pythium insidiosum]|nr:hypothetical protein PINS_up012897 [Pythium insidiosum]
MDSQRSYVSDGDTLSSRRGIAISDLETATEATEAPVAEPTKVQKADEKALGTRSATSVTPQQKTTTPTSVRPAPTDVSLHSMGVLGFSNLGNTCYFNAATQALLTSLHCFPDVVHEDEVIERIATGPIAATLMCDDVLCCWGMHD